MDPDPQGRALAEVEERRVDAHQWDASEPPDSLQRAVGRAVVNDDDLLVEAQSQHPLDDALDGDFLVVDGNDERDPHASAPAPCVPRRRLAKPTPASR